MSPSCLEAYSAVTSIKAAYPPLAVMKNKFVAKEYGKPRAPFLGDLDSGYRLEQTADASDAASIPAAFENETDIEQGAKNQNANLEQVIEESVSEAMSSAAITQDETNEMKSNLIEPLTDDEDVASRINATWAGGAGKSRISAPATVVLTKTIDADASSPKKAKRKKSGAISDALSGLPDEVRAASQEVYDRSLLNINRSVI